MPYKIKTTPEKGFFFTDGTVTSPTGVFLVNFYPGGLAPGSGCQSSLFDLGPSPRTTLFEWRSVVRLQGIGETIIVDPNGTSHIVSVSGQPDMNFSVDQDLYPINEFNYVDSDPPHNFLTNHMGYIDSNPAYMGPIRTTEASVDADGNYSYTTSGLIHIYSKKARLSWFNNTNRVIVPSGNIIILTPVPDEIQ